MSTEQDIYSLTRDCIHKILSWDFDQEELTDVMQVRLYLKAISAEETYRYLNSLRCFEL